MRQAPSALFEVHNLLMRREGWVFSPSVDMDIELSASKNPAVLDNEAQILNYHYYVQHG